MKKAVLLALLLGGCASGTNYTPQTKEGAMCKSDCAHSMAICQGSSYSCDRAAATCMASCKEMESLR